MLIVFGTIYQDILFAGDAPVGEDAVIYANNAHLQSGGSALNQALAAVRSGPKTAIISKTGKDFYSDRIIQKARQAGITTTGVGHSTETHTGLHACLYRPDGQRQSFIFRGANDEITHDQIPDEILVEKNMILVQTDAPMKETATLLQRAKSRGVKTIMNLAPIIDLSRKALENLDYLIVNHREAAGLADKLGLSVSDQSLQIAQALAAEGKMNCILTLGAKGSVAVTKDGKAWSVDALAIENFVDKNGAEDAYAGTFAACIYNGLPLPRAMKRASIAASLTCAKAGSQDAFPYMDDIEAQLVNVPEPEQVNL